MASYRNALLCMLLSSCAASATETASVCAQNEGHTCHCQGTVFFGRKFVDGKPGGGETTSLASLIGSNTFKSMTVNGQVSCSNSAMGGDPLHGYYKWCYCVPEQAAEVCAQGEGDVCRCTGSVIYGKKHVAGQPGNGQTTTLVQMTQTRALKAMTVNGQITCGNDAIGADPLGGYYKWCYCISAATQTCLLTQQETLVKNYVTTRQLRVSTGQIAAQISSGSYTIDSLSDEMYQWWVQLSLAGQNTAIENFVNLMQHAQSVPSSQGFLSVVLGWLDLIFSVMVRPIAIAIDAWEIIQKAPLAMANSVATWQAAATKASESRNFLQAAIEFRSQLPTTQTRQLTMVSNYINALRNIPASQRNSGLLAAYEHVTIIIQSTISLRRAFNQYYNSFAPEPFSYEYGYTRNGRAINDMLWKPVPAGVDACPIEKYVKQLNQGCISRDTPGFETVQFAVSNVGIWAPLMGVPVALHYNCSDLGRTAYTGCWSPGNDQHNPYNAYRVAARNECNQVADGFYVGYIGGHLTKSVAIPQAVQDFCFNGISGTETVCDGSRRMMLV